MTPVRLKPAASQSRVKHSTTEPLHSASKVNEQSKGGKSERKEYTCVLIKSSDLLGLLFECNIVLNSSDYHIINGPFKHMLLHG